MCDIGVRPSAASTPDERASLTTALVAKISLDVARPCTRDGDVPRSARIVLPLVQRHGDARAVVDADLQKQVFALASLVQLAHGMGILSAATIARSVSGRSP